MSKSISVAADLKIESDQHQIVILSNSEEIGISIKGERLPNLGISSFKALKLLRSLPAVQLDQRITIVFNQKEIYRSDKSLFKQSNLLLLTKLFFRNLF